MLRCVLHIMLMTNDIYHDGPAYSCADGSWGFIRAGHGAFSNLDILASKQRPPLPRSRHNHLVQKAGNLEYRPNAFILYTRQSCVAILTLEPLGTSELPRLNLHCHLLLHWGPSLETRRARTPVPRSTRPFTEGISSAETTSRLDFGPQSRMFSVFHEFSLYRWMVNLLREDQFLNLSKKLLILLKCRSHPFSRWSGVVTYFV